MPAPHFCVLFDLDGTLVDTAPDLTGALNTLLVAEGRPRVNESDVRHMVGHGARSLILRGFALTGIALDEEREQARIDALVVKYLSTYQANITRASRAFPGVAKALETLADKGAVMGVCTNKVEDLSHELLAKLGLADHFGAVIGGDTLPLRKPDAEPLLEAMRRLNAQKLPAVMIGDSESDVGAARNAHIPVILVSFGYTPVPAAELGGDVVIDHFDALLPAISKLLGLENTGG